MNSEEFTKIARELQKQGISCILHHKDCGNAVLAKTMSDRLTLIHIAEIEKEYVDRLIKLKAEAYVNSNNNTNQEKMSYMG